jgi:hypothetical protein
MLRYDLEAANAISDRFEMVMSGLATIQAQPYCWTLRRFWLLIGLFASKSPSRSVLPFSPWSKVAFVEPAAIAFVNLPTGFGLLQRQIEEGAKA